MEQEDLPKLPLRGEAAAEIRTVRFSEAVTE